MNVPYTVKVPIEVAMALKDREIALRTALRAELEVATSTEQKKKIYDRSKVISFQNLIRIVIMEGFPGVSKMKDAALLDRMMVGAVLRGRPTLDGGAARRAA